MSPSLLRLCALAALVACASGPEIRDRKIPDSPAEATGAGPPASPAAPQDPRALAAEFLEPEACEQAARDLLPRSGDRAWALLRECVNRGLTSLRLVVDPAWAEQLRTRKDAPVVLAKVVASRGGDVEGDLSLLQQRRIPVFGLAAALEQPQVYSGRMVLLRMRVNDLKVEGGRASALAAEIRVASVPRDGAARPVGVGASQVVGASYGTGAYDGSGYPPSQGPRAQGGAASFPFGRTGEAPVEYGALQSSENEAGETGRGVLLSMAKADPFLAPGKQFVVLARFEGARATGHVEEGVGARLGLLTLVAYFEPAALMIE